MLFYTKNPLTFYIIFKLTFYSILKENNQSILDNFKIRINENGELLEEKLNELKFLETHRNNKEFFLMVFMKNEVYKENLLNKLNHMQNVSITLKNINLEKKMKILFKLNNMNTKLM